MVHIIITHSDILERMREELKYHNDEELERMLKCYDKLVVRDKKRIGYAEKALANTKQERNTIIEEVIKRLERRCVS